MGQDVFTGLLKGRGEGKAGWCQGRRAFDRRRCRQYGVAGDLTSGAPKPVDAMFSFRGLDQQMGGSRPDLDHLTAHRPSVLLRSWELGGASRSWPARMRHRLPGIGGNFLAQTD